MLVGWECAKISCYNLSEMRDFKEELVLVWSNCCCCWIFLNICQWFKYLHLMLLNLLLSIQCGTWAITHNTTAHRSAKGPTRTDVLHTQAFQGDGRLKYKEIRVRVSCKSALSWLLNFPRGQRLWRVINTIVRLRNYCENTRKMCWIQPMTVSREESTRPAVLVKNSAESFCANKRKLSLVNSRQNLEVKYKQMTFTSIQYCIAKKNHAFFLKFQWIIQKSFFLFCLMTWARSIIDHIKTRTNLFSYTNQTKLSFLRCNVISSYSECDLVKFLN